jgi:hypothetical protein
MFNKIMKDILTVSNGNDYDHGRVLGFIVLIAFLLFSAINIFLTHHFDAMEFGTAVGVIFGAIGINLKLKENTEPK